MGFKRVVKPKEEKHCFSREELSEGFPENLGEQETGGKMRIYCSTEGKHDMDPRILP